MPYRHRRAHPEASTLTSKRRKAPVRAQAPTEEVSSPREDLQHATEARVAQVLTSRFTWFLNPIRILAVAEDLRVVARMRELHLGVLVVSVILSAFSRSSDTEGRVRDAFALYRQIHTSANVTDEAFRRAMGRAAEVLLHLLLQWTREQNAHQNHAPLRGRLAFFSDLRMTDSTAFKVARALATGLPGSGSSAGLKLHAVYSLRAGTAVQVDATAASEHDSPHFVPTWICNALYLWDLGYNDYTRMVQAHLARAFFVQRLKDKANPRMLAWYDADGTRHAVSRGERGALRHLEDVLSLEQALQHGGPLDLDVVLDGTSAEGFPCQCVVRVVCVPTDGTDRYYLTNLPRAHFSPHDVAELYTARWDVELLFKDWQGGCRLDEVSRLSNLNTLRSVVYGGLLAHLLARELARAGEEPQAHDARRPRTDEDDAVDIPSPPRNAQGSSHLPSQPTACADFPP
jgi:hypothetical protein